MSTNTLVPDAKQVVLDFYDLAFVKRQPAQARTLYLSSEYKQHNPTAPDGAEVFPDLINGLFSQVPNASFHLKRVVAEGDLVVLHYNLKMFPDDLGQAVVDIFRIDGGRIVEHWDVIQPVPSDTNNDNGMF